ncbi:MAG: alpha/beta hydrolase family protein [Opitutaceae bacterium]|nr:alpha/beta hydrolase family protein [Opitutaceae bacterium]
MKAHLSFLLIVALAASQLCAADPGGSPANLPAQPVMVLVHGASGGGWQFKQVAALMEAKGWKIHRPSLSGLGEHFHTATAEIGLGTHIADIVNFILFEDLRDVILLGHSYAGFVIAGVAERIPDRIRRLVYLDAFVPLDGESLLSTRRPDTQDMKNLKDGFLIRPEVKPGSPVPHLVPHPFKTFTETIALKNPAAAKVPGTVILTVAKGRRPEDDTFWFSTVRARERGWPVHIMEATHFPMLLQPEATAALLMNTR